MNERLEQIRRLLGELEVEMRPGAPAGDRDFSALELPAIIQQIVDDLQPQLTPYDAAFYWFLFRHSIARDGDPRLRVSTRHLRTAVVKSSYSQLEENPVSLGKVQDTLRARETIGAIRKEGEPNRDGTLYRVLIPGEIEACRKYRAERQADEPEPELKFPRSAHDDDILEENRIKIYERDGYICRYCQKQLTRFTATLDHVKPVAEGGDNSLENLVTACLDCRTKRNRGAAV
ncbi:MAG: HNH endonuclease signature motif containing protein [Terracidiphilus sp.]